MRASPKRADLPFHTFFYTSALNIFAFQARHYRMLSWLQLKSDGWFSSFLFLTPIWVYIRRKINNLAVCCTESNLLLDNNKTKKLIVPWLKKKKEAKTYTHTAAELSWSMWTLLDSWESLGHRHDTFTPLEMNVLPKSRTRKSHLETSQTLIGCAQPRMGRLCCMWLKMLIIS